MLLGDEVGLRHSEMILFGLDIDTLIALIKDVGDQVRNGHFFLAGSRCGTLLKDRTCAFKAVGKSQFRHHMLSAH
jgi:hypothetical protein